MKGYICINSHNEFYRETALGRYIGNPHRFEVQLDNPVLWQQQLEKSGGKTGWVEQPKKDWKRV